MHQPWFAILTLKLYSFLLGSSSMLQWYSGDYQKWLINGLQGLYVKMTASVMVKHNLMTSQSILTAAKFNGLIIPLKSPHKSKFSLRNYLRKEMISITTLTWRALRLQNLQAVDHVNRLWHCIGLMNLMPLPAASSQLLLSCQTVLPLDLCKMPLKGFVPHTRLRVWV